jgi:hypothetical protein
VEVFEMPRVVPSQIVAFIDQAFSWAAAQNVGVGTNLVRQNSGLLAGLLDLLEKVPDELISLNGASYSSLVASSAAIKNRLSLWQAQAEPPALELVFVSGLPQLSPVRLIRDAMSLCPDQNPAPATTQLNFITDAALCANLRSDIGAVDRALSDGEWKGATVLAGSTIEAILLWDLQNRRIANVPTAVATLVANHTFTGAPSANLEDWSLHHYTEVAAQLGIITAETAIEVRLAKSFRNLIHPGRAQRLGQKCDRGTALSSVAALDHVVRDLS